LSSSSGDFVDKSSSSSIKSRKDRKSTLRFVDRLFGNLNHETVFVVAGLVFALVLLITIVSSIAWVVTNKRQGKNGVKGENYVFHA